MCFLTEKKEKKNQKRLINMDRKEWQLSISIKCTWLIRTENMCNINIRITDYSFNVRG